ncbi:MAG: hypothetical protein ABSF29_11420 [Tepidisphaeraceae bacterium]|jgi:hypothetical protein
MNEIERIQKLAGNPPGEAINVTDRVMREIGELGRQESEPPTMWLAALLSSGAAVAAVLLCLQSIWAFQDPFGDFLTSIWTVLR